MDLFFFPNRKRNPRYGLLKYFENKKIRVLDVCFGTEASSLLIAQNNPNMKISGVDLSPEMISKSRKKIKALDLRSIEIMEMDAYDMNFKTGSYDAAIISLGLHEIPLDQTAKILQEVSRILKKDSFLYIIEWEKPKKNLLKIIMFIFIKLIEPSWFSDFLSIEWSSYLSSNNFKLSNIEYFDYTKLIVAAKSI